MCFVAVGCGIPLPLRKVLDGLLVLYNIDHDEWIHVES